MVPGTVVVDYNFKCFWSVVSNDGKKVTLRALKGGEDGTKITVSDNTTNNSFTLVDIVEELNRYENLVINAIEWAVNVSEQHTYDLIRAMGITSEELSTIGYDEDNFPKMYEWTGGAS